jgi:hypothetical protein
LLGVVGIQLTFDNAAQFAQIRNVDWID